MAHQTVHIPIQYRKEEGKCSKIKSKARRAYCSMIVELDRAIGETIELFTQTGLWDNTFVLLTTDNGGMVPFARNKNGTWPADGASMGSNYPLRGSKSVSTNFKRKAL